MPRLLSFRVQVINPDKSKHEFTVLGTVTDPDIKLAQVAFHMEHAINEHVPYLRVHADILEAE